MERTRLTEFRDLALTNFRRVSSEPNFFYSELRSKRIQKDYQKDFLLIELEMDSFSFFALKEKKSKSPEIPVEEQDNVGHLRIFSNLDIFQFRIFRPCEPVSSTFRYENRVQK